MIGGIVPIFNKRILAMLLSACSLSAHAFLTDTTKQKVILIGKGGAKNMQSVPVYVPSEQPAVQISNSVSITPKQATASAQYLSHQPNQNPSTYQTSAYQNSYNSSNYYTNSYENPKQGYLSDSLSFATNSQVTAVFDLMTGQPLYQKNIDQVRSIASITKLMTAMVVLDSGQDFGEPLTATSSDFVGAKHSSSKILTGDTMDRASWMLMMLMRSENPAAKLLARNYKDGYNGFIAAMNQKAQNLGMYSTSFSDASGLNPKNVSSATDLYKMVREISTNPRYETIRNFSSSSRYSFYIDNPYRGSSRVYNAVSTNRIMNEGDAGIRLSKTGFIKEAGYCVVMQTTYNGRPSVLVLLGANDSNRRWSDARTVLSQLAYLQ